MGRLAILHRLATRRPPVSTPDPFSVWPGERAGLWPLPGFVHPLGINCADLLFLWRYLSSLAELLSSPLGNCPGCAGDDSIRARLRSPTAPALPTAGGDHSLGRCGPDDSRRAGDLGLPDVPFARDCPYRVGHDRLRPGGDGKQLAV